jgi:hypothetical protein
MQHACLEAPSDNKTIPGQQFCYYCNTMKAAQKLQMHLSVKCVWGVFKAGPNVSAPNIMHVTSTPFVITDYVGADRLTQGILYCKISA